MRNMLRNMIKLLRELKHSKPSIIVCPKCGSTKIHLASRLDSWLMPSIYVCDDCGYHGPIVMELEKKEANTFTDSEH